MPNRIVSYCFSSCQIIYSIETTIVANGLLFSPRSFWQIITSNKNVKKLLACTFEREKKLIKTLLICFYSFQSQSFLIKQDRKHLLQDREPKKINSNQNNIFNITIKTLKTLSSHFDRFLTYL